MLLCGMAYLISKRHLPIMRIRGLGLSLVAITLLHLYWISVQLGYIIGALAPGDAEYWIMGTYFPFGIALFHASNTRFLHVAKAQKKYATKQNPGLKPRGKGIIATFKRMDYTSKMIVVVGLGMIFQVCTIKKAQIRLIILTMASALPHYLHVPRLAQVPPLVWYSGN